MHVSGKREYCEQIPFDYVLGSALAQQPDLLASMWVFISIYFSKGLQKSTHFSRIRLTRKLSSRITRKQLINLRDQGLDF